MLLGCYDMYLISCHNENWMGGMVVGLKELMGFVSFGWCHWLGGTWLGFGGLKDDGIELRAFLLLASHEFIWIHMNSYEYMWIHINTYVCVIYMYIHNLMEYVFAYGRNKRSSNLSDQGVLKFWQWMVGHKRTTHNGSNMFHLLVEYFW